MTAEKTTDAAQPLRGVRVVEFTHMVMGPTCGMVLADLGAEVIKVEPIDGDRTRRLLGAGAGFFPMFNRNKKSIGIDLQADPTARRSRAAGAVGRRGGRELQARHDGQATGSTTPACRRVNPRLIYVSHKGFLPGPYEHRTALDEVVQMMGGLAYMTGRPGDPLRAGTERQRHHGRAVRRHRHAGRADPARHHRPRHGGAVGAVREQRVPRGPAHAAVRDDRQASGARCPRATTPGPSTTSSRCRAASRSSWLRSATPSGAVSATRWALPT
jgi:hypothetical protein